VSDESIVGGRELDAFLQSLSVKVERNILRAALRAGANEFKAEALAKVPVLSGKVRRSLKVTTGSKGGRVTAKLKAGGKAAPHAMLVEFGTKPHRIAPKNGGGLVIGGHVVGAVHHPGSKAKPYLRPSFDSKSTAAIGAVAAKIRERLTAEGINVPAPEGA
jgi:HK97 gp10 family phage protein